MTNDEPRMPSQYPPIPPGPAGTHHDIEIRKTNAEQRQPSPLHVVIVEPRNPSPEVKARLEFLLLFTFLPRAGETVEPAADQVPHRVAAQGKPGQQDDVDQHDECSQADTELPGIRVVRAAAVGVPPESHHHVPPQEDQEAHGNVQRVAMNVLEDKREVTLPPV